MHPEIGVLGGLAIVLVIGSSAGLLLGVHGQRGVSRTLFDMVAGTLGAWTVAFLLPMAGHPLAKGFAGGLAASAAGAVVTIGLARLAWRK